MTLQTLKRRKLTIALVLVVFGISIPILASRMQRAGETALKDNLRSLRVAIDQYTADKRKAPASLQDLVDAGYLRELPVNTLLIFP